MQDFAASVREHVKNTGTKPVQLDLLGEWQGNPGKRKNPRSVATETGIKSLSKVCGFQRDTNAKRVLNAIGNPSATSETEAAS